MNIEKSKRLTIIIIVIFMGLYFITKPYLRTLDINNSFLKIIIGSLPNLTSAIVLPLLFVIDIYKAKSLQALTKINRRVNIIMLIVFVILLSEEFYPIFSGSKVFDFWDIVFSIIGITFTFYYKTKIIEIVKKNKNYG
jgi:hypothetical protein